MLFKWYVFLQSELYTKSQINQLESLDQQYCIILFKGKIEHEHAIS